MEIGRSENNLYSLLGQFFVKSLTFDDDFLIKNSLDSFGIKNTLDLKQQKRTKSCGFEMLLMSTIPDSKISKKSQIFSLIYDLKSSNAKNAQEIEKMVIMLEESGQLDEILPLLILLFNIEPVKIETISQLKKLEPEFSQSTNSSHQFSEDCYKLSSDHCHPYDIYSSNIFKVESIDYVQKEPYSFSIISKLDSTQQFDALDFAHCKLFGALSHFPQNLNYLGISHSSKLRIGFKKIEEVESNVSQKTDEGISLN